VPDEQTSDDDPSSKPSNAHQCSPTSAVMLLSKFLPTPGNTHGGGESAAEDEHHGSKRATQKYGKLSTLELRGGGTGLVGLCQQLSPPPGQPVQSTRGPSVMAREDGRGWRLSPRRRGESLAVACGGLEPSAPSAESEQFQQSDRGARRSGQLRPCRDPPPIAGLIALRSLHHGKLVLRRHVLNTGEDIRRCEAGRHS